VTPVLHLLPLVLAAGGVAEHWQLSYSLGIGVARCPSETELRQGIGARLGHDPFAATASARVSVAVELVGRELRGRVLLERGLDEPIREQQFTSGLEECAELASAMELAVAIAIDPLSLTRPRPAPPVGTPSPAPSPTAAPPLAARSSGAPENESSAPVVPRTIEGRVVLGGSFALGTQPGPAAGGALAFEIRWKWFALGLEGDYLLPATGTLGPGQVQSSLLGGKLLPCADFGLLGACAVVWAAAERGQILPVDPLAARTTALMLAAGGRALRDVSLSNRLFLRGQVDILAPVYYHPLHAQNGIFVWNNPPLSLTLGLGLGWRLP
jgi:hypothetical protein